MTLKLNQTMRSLTILGSTGSVGKSTLAVLDLHSDLFKVQALTANKDVSTMLAQCQKYQPQQVVMADHKAAHDLSESLQQIGLTGIEVLRGQQSICDVAGASESDSIMSAVVGAVGLLPTLEAVRAGKRVLIANKEPLVMTGSLLMSEAKKSGAWVLPIDSEHNAIFQCLPDDQNKRDVARLHLTASGGPFRGRAWHTLENITPDQACSHPNWSMGRKISVDSATMMNKGLELIEAAALFDMPENQVEIVVHPQSIIHSMVEYLDGSFLAQLGAPDMRIPIAHALNWPRRIASGAQTLNLCDIARLDFQAPDMDNLPCLQLAREAASLGGGTPTVLNAANEIAVEAFLANKLAFTEIPTIIRETMKELQNTSFKTIDEVLLIDNEARQLAASQLDSGNW